MNNNEGSFNLSTSSRANADLMVRLQGSAVRELTVFWQVEAEEVVVSVLSL